MHSKTHPRPARVVAVIKAIAAALIAVFTLAACGGFAGSSSDTTGSGSGVAVPDDLIPNAGTGERDRRFMSGCAGDDCFDGNIKTADNSVYADGVTLGYRRLQDVSGNDHRLTVPTPPQDVRDAWSAGWTGEGVQALVIDAFGGPEVPTDNREQQGTHGYTVFMALREIADSAHIGYMEAGLSSEGGGTGRGYRQTHIPGTPDNLGGEIDGPTTTIHVINMSFGVEADNHYAGRGEIEVFYLQTYNRNLYADLTGDSNRFFRVEPYLKAADDSVITKAAGNNAGVDAARYIDNLALIDHQHTGPRSIIVGALDKYARASTTDENTTNVSNRASIAEYSAHAGGHGGMQRRFLVEYGGTPYGVAAHLVCDETVLANEDCSGSQDLDNRYHERPLVGTSFAAPRVAGFAALVRDKFPGLSGAQTAEILLDTATTVGLACHTGNARKSPDCPRSIYGQGRVSIDDALSPMGKLN